MRDVAKVSWVVYRMTLNKHPDGMLAVCEQAEWDAMERDRPGYHALVRGGFTNECDAERLVRDELATSIKATVRLKSR